jgi:hypothetical protein
VTCSACPCPRKKVVTFAGKVAGFFSRKLLRDLEMEQAGGDLRKSSDEPLMVSPVLVRAIEAAMILGFVAVVALVTAS